ncbi:hypothetical protein NHF50_00655 [Flavobacterium sp. NRK F10]|uniref:hypothetical protein n=1 Tax=Flavobacterium sp. NRK F10 TaxID=2954931 RepID=UPI0020911D4D|nr:hypothetical protein [Flavobacterium sp. NRK F10]MCO6173545.1 hypothetical protein [Flavobacterium sp. NRK F10]
MLKKILSLTFLGFCLISGIAQEHFTGISTSKRVGIVNTVYNPSEIVNLSTKYEVNVFNASLGLSNNKLTFNDLIKGTDLEDKIFEGNENVNLRLDGLILGPAFAFKIKQWGFGLTSMAHIKANVINVDAKLGDAIQNGRFSDLISQTTLSSSDNQRINGVTWGEIDLIVGRNIIDLPKHALNAGASIRFLFPGAYGNFSATNLNGTIVNTFGDVELVNASAEINLAYAGSLAGAYNDQGNYNDFFSQGINGLAVDLGFNYIWKDETDNENYKLKAGISVRNLGSMTFKSDQNLSQNYVLNVDNLESLNLNQFENVESLEELNQIIADPANANYFQATTSTDNYTIKLPTTLNAYVDYQLAKKWYVTASMNQKINDDSDNDIVTTQNSYTLIPRYSYKWFEAYVPIGSNEISGFTTGMGFRLSAFFIGSNSVITALTNSGKQADLYLGVRFGF